MAFFYDKAASLLKTLLDKKGTIKSLVYKDDVPDKKRMFKLICEFLKCIHSLNSYFTLKDKDAVDTIIQASGILKEKVLNLNLARVLVFELLFASSKGPSGNSKGKKILLKYQTRLMAELVKLKIKLNAQTNKDLIPESLRNQITLPRYIRVNTNKTTVKAVIAHFITLGYQLIDTTTKQPYPTKHVCVDTHIPNLLVLPHSVDLHEDPLLLNGSIIIQDKASCFPAFILNPESHIHVIDACAAPGNKTSHLSAIMKNKGRIFAFDADKRRLETLKTLTNRAGCKNIEPIHVNFLSIDPFDEKYSKVECILLDPSCSGSGIVGRLDHLTEQESSTVFQSGEKNALGKRSSTNEDGPSNKKLKSNTSKILDENIGNKERLASLSEFQFQAIMHSFSFPNVKKVVYSTCSKNPEENELVVKRVLEAQSDYKLADSVFPAWERRGMSLVDGHEKLVRTNPELDGTIGFFVALFVKC